MKINPNVPGVQQHINQQNSKKAEHEVKPDQKVQKEVEYIPSSNADKKVTYENPGVKKPDQNVIAELKKASDERLSALKRMVEEMLARQGMTFRDVEAGKTVEVDETTRAEAQTAVAEGGEFSAEAVSDRIVEFAKAISGEDKGKLDLLIGAIDEGFAKAKEIIGNTLPGISQRTYDLIMEKLDAWKNEE